MKLIENLYIVKQEPTRQESLVGSTFIYIISMQAGSEVYRAHFPDEAITPGACLVGIVKELTERILGENLKIRQIKNLKFLAPLYPTQDGPEVQVSLFFKAKDCVAAEMKTPEGVICKMTLTLR